jgi:phage-related minor tail protein
MELKNDIEGFSRDASRALVDFAFGAEMTFSNMITSMLKELARLVIQRSIMDPIVNSVSGALGGAGGIGGLLGSAPMAAGGTGSGFMGWLSGILPARAVGGDVMANSPYIVGEKGKELFVPKTAGTIVPSGNIGGGTQVNNVSISITESGSKTEQGDSTKLAKQLEAAVVKVLIDQKRQGGVYA